MKTPSSKLSNSLLCTEGRLALVKRFFRRPCRTAPKVALRGAAAVMALFALFGFNPQSLAATDTWTGGDAGPSTDWVTSDNWSYSTGTGPVASGDSLVFGSANGSGSTTLTDSLTNTGFNIAGITYNPGALAYMFTGNPFALTGEINNEGTNLETIDNAIGLTAVEILNTTAGGGNITIGGVISGAGGGITITGPGTVTLSASDTFTGATTIGAGSTLSLTGGINGSAISSGSSGFIESATGTINGGSLTLFTSGSGGTATLAGINNTGNITVGNTAAATEASPGQLQITGGSTVSSGTIAIAGYSGANSTTPAAVPMLEVTGGTLSAVAYTTGTSGNESGNSASFTGNSVVSFGSTTDGNNFSDGGNITIATTGTVSLGNYIIGRNGGVQQAPSTTGGLIINSGSVTAVSINSSNLSTDIGRVGDINLNGGSLTITASTAGFELGDSTDSGNDFFDMSGGTLTYAGADGLLTSAVTNGTAADVYTGIVITGGTATLAGITLNSTSAAYGTSYLNVSGGTLYLGGVGLVLNLVSGATVTGTFGTATIGATAPWSSSAPITLTGTAAVTGTTTFQSANASGAPEAISLGGVLSGAGGLTATGGGTLTLSAVNTYTGNTGVATGATLDIAGAGSLGSGAYAGNIADSGTFSYGSSATQTLSGAISGTGALIQNGAGALTLSGVSSYTGPITINAGTLAISGAGSIGSGAYPGNIANSGTFSYGSTANQTLSGTISGTGALTKAGLGKLTLGGSNSYTGATNVTGGTLALNSSTPLANTAVTVASGATLQVTPSLGAAAIGSAGGASLVLNGGSTLLLGGATAGTAETTAFDTLTLNGGLMIGGPASAAGLIFDLNGASNDELVVTGAVTFGTDGGVITLVVPSSSTAPSGASQTYTLVSAGSGLTSGGLTLAGTDIVSLGGNSYAASLSETGGTTETLTLNEVTLTYYWAGGTSASWSVPGNFATDHTAAAFQSSQLGVTNNVILTADSPSGTHTASQTLDNSYTINSLSFSSTAPAINLATGSGGNGASNTLTLDAVNGFGVTVGSSSPVTTTYGAGIGLVMQNGSAAQTLNVPVLLGNSQTWEIDSATNALTVQGVISDGGAGKSLTKTGIGALILQNAETYSGGTIVSGGTLQLGSGGSLLSASPLTVQGTGTFDLAGNSQTISTLSDGGVATGTITSSSGTPTLGVGSGTFSGTISGNLSLTEVGSSTLTLSGANSYTGPTTVNSGTLISSNNSALGNSGSSTGGLSLAGSAAVADLTSSTPSIASLSGVLGSSLVLGNATGSTPTTLTVTGAGSGSGTTFAGAISNASAAGYGNLTISGGALTLSGSNTFTGTTLVSGGTLTIGNTYALQDSTVNPAGGTLSFTQPTATFGALTGSGNLSAGTVALTIGGIGSTNIYSGSLTGSGGLTTVNATGVETLTNYNNTGNLAVGAGGAAAAADSLTISGGTFGSSASTLGIESSTEGTTFDMSGGTATFGTVNIAINSGNTGSGMTISGGTAVFTTTNLGSGGNTGGNLIISGSSTNVALGAYTDNRDENGGLEIEGGTVTATSLAMLGAGNSHGVNTTISGGSLTIGNSSSTGAFEIASGGAVTEDLNVSGGSLTYLGADGLLLNIGAFPTAVSLTGGVTSLTGITLDDVNSATVGSTLVVNDGATLYLGSVGLNEGSTPTVDSGASVTLATGTIGALANWSTSVPIVLTTGSTTTFQAADANSVAHDITLNGAISGGGTMAKTGAGVELLSANNSYTGATVVNGGTLEVSGAISGTASVSVNNATLELAAGNALNSVAPITLQSGVLQVLASQSEALGTLALNGGASTLSLGTSGDVINFADSSALAWTGTLAISDWNGASAGGGSDEVFFGATNDLTHAQLADITFTDGSVDGNSFVTDSAVQLADGELVAAAIPEPGAWAMMLAGAGMLCVWQRTRRRARNGRALDSGARSA